MCSTRMILWFHAQPHVKYTPCFCRVKPARTTLLLRRSAVRGKHYETYVGLSINNQHPQPSTPARGGRDQSSLRVALVPLVCALCSVLRVSGSWPLSPSCGRAAGLARPCPEQLITRPLDTCQYAPCATALRDGVSERCC
jgi:hypothetical protein